MIDTWEGDEAACAAYGRPSRTEQGASAKDGRRTNSHASAGRRSSDEDAVEGHHTRRVVQADVTFFPSSCSAFTGSSWPRVSLFPCVNLSSSLSDLPLPSSACASISSPICTAYDTLGATGLAHAINQPEARGQPSFFLPSFQNASQLIVYPSSRTFVSQVSSQTPTSSRPSTPLSTNAQP
jgi:hypothetical protein